jgi:hypothetical protein
VNVGAGGNAWLHELPMIAIVDEVLEVDVACWILDGTGEAS